MAKQSGSDQRKAKVAAMARLGASVVTWIGGYAKQARQFGARIGSARAEALADRAFAERAYVLQRATAMGKEAIRKLGITREVKARKKGKPSRSVVLETLQSILAVQLGMKPGDTEVKNARELTRWVATAYAKAERLPAPAGKQPGRPGREVGPGGLVYREPKSGDRKAITTEYCKTNPTVIVLMLTQIRAFLPIELQAHLPDTWSQLVTAITSHVNVLAETKKATAA